jgi:hypothetical protein
MPTKTKTKKKSVQDIQSAVASRSIDIALKKRAAEAKKAKKKSNNK